MSRPVPCPGSFITSKDKDETHFVVAMKALSYPGSWNTYELTLLRDSCIKFKSIEVGHFHNFYDVRQP